MFCCRSTQNNPLGKSGQRLLYKNYLFKNKTEVNKTGANPESLVSVCVGGGRGETEGIEQLPARIDTILYLLRIL